MGVPPSAGTVASSSVIATHDTRQEPVGRAVVWTAGITALGGLLFGYDTGVVSGALLFLHTSFRNVELVRQRAGHRTAVGRRRGRSAGLGKALRHDRSAAGHFDHSLRLRARRAGSGLLADAVVPHRHAVRGR